MNFAPLRVPLEAVYRTSRPDRWQVRQELSEGIRTNPAPESRDLSNRRNATKTISCTALPYDGISAGVVGNIIYSASNGGMLWCWRRLQSEWSGNTVGDGHSTPIWAIELQLRPVLTTDVRGGVPFREYLGFRLSLRCYPGYHRSIPFVMHYRRESTLVVLIIVWDKRLDGELSVLRPMQFTITWTNRKS